MKRLIQIAVAFTALLLLPAIGVLPSSVASAQLIYQGQVNASGVNYYKDPSVNRFWTVTLGQVPSNTWGVGAQQKIDQMAPGWRKPTFAELQQMYNITGGGPQVGFQNGLFDYYETSDPAILANAFGNGIRTPQKRAGVGNNWVIATWP
jgi:hypothetical protein